jgi:ATP-dependent Clp protease adapter protein ClpS
VDASSSSIRNDDVDNILLERKITLATEGFTTHKFCQLVLRDGSRLSKENALTITYSIHSSLFLKSVPSCN